MRSAARPRTPASEAGHVLIAFEVDLTGRVVRWTSGAELGLGWSPADAIGHLPPVPPPWHDIAEWHDIAQGTESLIDQPAVWRAADGSRAELAVCTTEVLGLQGHVLGVTITARDISVRTQVQAQLAEYARDIRESYGRELHRLADLEASYHATVEALAAAVESKDDTTGGHIRRVCQLGLLLAKAHLGAAADDPQLAYGFLLHDVGKLAVPDAVLNKPGQLDAAEWALIREHPEAGARILAQVPFLDRAIEVVLHHHERWDGTGYPSGLRGEAIPMWARLFAIVDTVDAMTSDRPYRAGMPLQEALTEVRAMSGSQFDPACVETFLSLPCDEVQAMLERHEPVT